MTEPASSRRTANRKRLVAAARSRILSDGVLGLSLDAVARDAGMTRKSVYNHFETRAGLLEAVMDDIGERADFRRMGSVLAVTPPEGLLPAVFAEVARAWEADAAMFRRVLGLLGVDEELGRAVGARMERVRGLADRVADQIAAGPGFDAAWGEQAARATLYALLSFSTYDHLRRSGLDQESAGRCLGTLAAKLVKP